jgi:hypothetical protein
LTPDRQSRHAQVVDTRSSRAPNLKGIDPPDLATLNFIPASRISMILRLIITAIMGSAVIYLARCSCSASGRSSAPPWCSPCMSSAIGHRVQLGTTRLAIVAAALSRSAPHPRAG